MKRSVKNIIMSIILVLAIALTGFTIYSAKKNIENTSLYRTTNKENNYNRPEKKTDESTKKQNDSEDSTEEQKDSEDTTEKKKNKKTKTEATNTVAEEDTTPPALPLENKEDDDDLIASEDDEPIGSPAEGGEPPMDDDIMAKEIPEGEPPSEAVPENVRYNPTTGTMEKVPAERLPRRYYVYFVLEGLVISTTAMYLVLSKGNKKTFKETFEDKDKIVICVLATLLLTGAIVATSSAISYNVAKTSSNTKEIGENNRHQNRPTKNDNTSKRKSNK